MKFLGKKHNNIIDESIRVENKLYNDKFIEGLNIKVIEAFDFHKSIGNSVLKDNNPFETVWLKNIDRLMTMIPGNIKTEKYCLLDVGSGLGISTIYFKEKYNFISVEGFDYDPKLVEMSKQIINEIYIDKTIIFYQADAYDYVLAQDKPYVLFLFNSFGKKTLNKFISNNIYSLQKNNSILLYCNDHHYLEVNGYSDFYRDDFYNLSAFLF